MFPSPISQESDRRPAKAFIIGLVLMGCLYSVHAVLNWQSADPFRYAIYVTTGCIGAVFMARRVPQEKAFSLSLILAPLGIVELHLAETITIVNAAWLSYYLFSQKRPRPALAGVALESAAVAAAHFAYHSLVPSDTSIAIRLFLAGGSFFVAHTFPTSVSSALERHTRIGQTWKSEHFWSFPHYFVGASAAGFLSVRNGFLHWEACLLVAPVLYVLYRARGLQETSAHRERQHFRELRDLHVRTIETLALTVEAKDGSTGRHLNRVQIYAVELGKELGLDEKDVETLRTAALLHDIGKLAVPDQILLKPEKLTPQEFSKIKIHPIVGAEILEHRFPAAVAAIVRAHHEKWDGTGYPDGLRGEAIPIGARILSAVDCLEALASDREYRRAVSLDQAMAMVAAHSGTSYDPHVIDLLHRCYRDFDQIAQQRTSDLPKLSTNAIVPAGAAPAAGFFEEKNAIRGELLEMAANVGVRGTAHKSPTTAPRDAMKSAQIPDTKTPQQKGSVPDAVSP